MASPILLSYESGFFLRPVATDTIHFMHNVGDLLEGSQKVSEGVWWGGEFEKLKFFFGGFKPYQATQCQILCRIYWMEWRTTQRRYEIDHDHIVVRLC